MTGPGREVDRALEGLEWIADLFLSTSAPIEAALPEILGRRREFQEAVRDRLGTNLGLLRRGGVAAPFQLLESEGGWSAVLRRRGEESGPDDDTDIPERILERHDVLLHPGHFYGLSDRHVVSSLIVEPSILEEALGRLAG